MVKRLSASLVKRPAGCLKDDDYDYDHDLFVHRDTETQRFFIFSRVVNSSNASVFFCEFCVP